MTFIFDKYNFYIFAHFENDEHHLPSISFHQHALAPILSFLCIFSNISTITFFYHFLVNYVFFFFFFFCFYRASPNVERSSKGAQGAKIQIKPWMPTSFFFQIRVGPKLSFLFLLHPNFCWHKKKLKWNKKKVELGLSFKFKVEPKFAFFYFCSIQASFGVEKCFDGTKKELSSSLVLKLELN
jgi:hypothetical protein